MKIKLKQYKYEKVEIAEKEIDIPETPVYFFETYIRRAIRIIPKFTTWNMNMYQKEEFLYEFEITFVYNSMECKVEKIKIPYTNLESLYYYKNNDIAANFVKSWLDDNLLTRTEEQFNSDLKSVIDEF